MVIDNDTHNKRERYRSGFDGLYQGKLNNYDADYFKPLDWKDEEDEEEAKAE